MENFIVNIFGIFSVKVNEPLIFNCFLVPLFEKIRNND